MRLPRLRVVVRTLVVTIAATLACQALTPPATAQDVCQPYYDAALAAIDSQAIGQGVQQKLRTKVENAWRMYRFDQPTKNSLKQLDVALRQLESPPTKTLSPSARAALSEAIRALRGCLAGAPPPNTATLIVRAHQLDETAPDLFGAPVPGAYVRVDGEPVGQTGADGSLTVQVPAGAIAVKVIVPSFSEGQASVNLPPGATDEVRILLDDSKEVVESTRLRLVEAPEDILPQSFASFTLEFFSDKTVVPLVRIEQVDLLDLDGNVAASLDSYFSLSASGAIVATNVAGLRSVLAGETQAVSVRAQGVDALGFTHADTVRFRMGFYQLIGYLVPPPSNPTLAVAGLAVKVEILGTGIVLQRTTDALGRFDVSATPVGNVAFDSQTFQGGIYYYGQGTIFLTSSRTISVVMRSVADVVNGVPPILSGAPAAASPAAASSKKNDSSADATTLVLDPGAEPETALAREIAEHEAQATPPPFPAPAAAPTASIGPLAAIAATSTASVYVVADEQNVPVSQTATLTVPQGTQKVVLTYNVFTYEYPFYVLQQSIFNDVWSVAVYAGGGGQQLYQITRNVNSQVSVSPVWQGNGSTGEIREVFDVAALAANQDVTVTLFASSMNIGDSLLATIVSASVSTEVDLSIDSIEPDVVTPTRGNSSFYSIPRPGATNTFERWFTLAVTKPDSATISRVTARLRGPGDLQTIVDEGPGPNVQVVDNQTLRVRATFHGTASAVASTPPPTSSLTYRFKVQADDNGQTLEDEKDSGSRRALWRMPDGIARYGIRDTGGDDWVSRGAYSWISTNSGLLTRVDDISGEHARDIGHQTHERGVDIDLFHFYTFPGGVSGGANYTQLANNVIAALNGDAAAQGRVSAWVTATRNGLGNLLARTEVNRLYYAIGSAAQQQVAPGVVIRLADGWARSLIETGAVTAASGQALNLALGNWTHANSARVRYNAIHNSHVHIALNSNALPN